MRLHDHPCPFPPVPALVHQGKREQVRGGDGRQNLWEVKWKYEKVAKREKEKRKNKYEINDKKSENKTRKRDDHTSM